MADDYKATTETTGTVTVGGSATGVIEKARDVDWFAVELVAGRTYVIDLEGADGGGTLTNAMLYGLFDGAGNRVARKSRDGGAGSDARIVFTATESGTHYIAAKGSRKEDTGSYTVRVTPEDADSVAAGAIDLGDIVALDGARLHRDSIDGGTDGTDYYRFTLSEAQAVTLVLRGQDANADLFLEDGDGNVLHASTRDGTRREKIAATLEAGTYYVRVAAQETGDNAYTLRAKAQDPEPPSVSPSVSEPAGTDFPADTATAGRVTVDGSATGYIETPDDVDWFAVTLEKGKTYRIDLKGWRSGDNTLSNPWLRGIHDADGNLIADTADNDSGRNYNSRVFFTPTEDATYYVAAGSDPSRYVGIDPNAGTGRGTYTLSVTKVDADDYAADTGTTGRVAVGGSVRGEIELPGDIDWFAVTLEKGKTYRFDLKGGRSSDNMLSNPWLRGIHDADGNLIAGTANNNNGHTLDSRVLFTPEESGTYYVAAGSDPGTGTYTLAVEEATDDYAADTSTTGRVAVGGSATGEISADADLDMWRRLSRDVDWFKVTLEKDKIYRIDVKGQETGDGTLWNPVLPGVYDADGNLLPGSTAYVGGQRNNVQHFLTVGESGTYYVAAGGVYVWDKSGTYTVSVTEVTDDYAASTATTGTVAAGGSTEGVIETEGDRDWFRVTLEAGKTYRFDMWTGWHRVAAVLHGIYDADGDFVASVPNIRSGAKIYGHTQVLGFFNKDIHGFFTPTESGTYYVEAGGASNYPAPDRTGGYTLSMIEVTDDFAADTGTTGTVVVDGSATGEIERRDDVDWFAVTLTKGVQYQIDLKARATGNGTMYNPYLRGIHDAKGNLIAGTADDDGGTSTNSRVSFTPAESGTYYVAASGAQNHYTGIGTYTLSVEEIVDDYAADTSTTGRVAVGGSATGEIERRDDVDWFAVTLTKGVEYQIDLRARGTVNSRMHDPYLRGIHDADGNLIAGTADNDSGRYWDSRVFFTPTESGTYYVAAGGAQNHYTGIGTYTLAVEEAVDAM